MSASSKRVLDQRLLDLVGQTYDAALDERLWSGLAVEIARTFESTSAVVQTRLPTLQQVDLLGVTANFDAKSAALYEQYYWQHDVWAIRLLAGLPWDTFRF